MFWFYTEGERKGEKPEYPDKKPSKHKRDQLRKLSHVKRHARLGLSFSVLRGKTRYITYNITCSFCIFIGRGLCVIKVHTHGWRQLMAWSNLNNLFCGSSHDFCQLYYNIKQIDFIFACVCTVIDHRWRHSVWRTKSHGTRLCHRIRNE